MNRLLLMILVFGLVSCQTTQKTVPVNYHDPADDKPPFERPEEFQTVEITSETKIWVSNEYKVIQTNDDDIQMFVKDLAAWQPDFYLAVNTKPENEKNFVSSTRAGWTELSNESVNILGIEYSNTVGYFDILKEPNGEYQNIINKTPYSAPKCGLVSEYTPPDNSFIISFVDAISCGEFSLAVKHDEILETLSDYARGFYLRYSESLDDRVEILRDAEEQGFGFLD